VTLTPEELRRYGRHLVLPEVGLDGQEKLKESSVLVVGAGGLGSPLAMYLAAAGVGRIGLVDFDTVELSNLQRQILYAEDDVGRPKLEAARERLRAINPHVQLVPHPVRLARENALEILSGYDLVADGTDNFATRYLVNDACVFLNKPNVHGSILRFEGQVSVFWAGKGPCYRCLFPTPPPPGTVQSCAEGGVLGVLPGIIGALQGMEAIKLLLSIGRSLVGRLLLFDGLEMNLRTLKLRRDPKCPVCGEQPEITELLDYDAICGMPGLPPHEGTHHTDDLLLSGQITVEELHARLQQGAAPVLLDVREPEELRICHLEGVIHIPLGELPLRMAELDKARDLVVICHTGIRSAYATTELRRAGFAKARNLVGGMEAWSLHIDPSMARY
jgi:molybdopterin/thiamine biosynthesis adenylyltransferase/rhodanese-related sulfurtransferase